MPLLLAVAIGGANAVTRPADATEQSRVQKREVPVPFDGTWNGTLFFDKQGFPATGSAPPASMNLRIDIHGEVVRVFINEDGRLAEVKPGMFHIAPVAANAVIYATEAGGGEWDETWDFAVTQKDARTLLVEYVRVVNNLGMRPSEPESRFGSHATGEFHLSDTAAVSP